MIQALIGTKLLLGLVSGFKEMSVKGGNGTAALSPALENDKSICKKNQDDANER